MKHLQCAFSALRGVLCGASHSAQPHIVGSQEPLLGTTRAACCEPGRRVCSSSCACRAHARLQQPDPRPALDLLLAGDLLATSWPRPRLVLADAAAKATMQSAADRQPCEAAVSPPLAVSL